MHIVIGTAAKHLCVYSVQEIVCFSSQKVFHQVKHLSYDRQSERQEVGEVLWGRLANTQFICGPRVLRIFCGYSWDLRDATQWDWPLECDATSCPHFFQNKADTEVIISNSDYGHVYIKLDQTLYAYNLYEYAYIHIHSSQCYKIWIFKNPTEGEVAFIL